MATYNMAEDVESFLAHHGVLGMHWGQRKADSAPHKETHTPQEIYDARARISNRNVKINLHRNSNTVYDNQKVKNLRAANKVDLKIANKNANAKERHAQGLGTAAIASWIAGYGAVKVGEMSSGTTKLGADAIGTFLSLAGTGLAVGAVTSQVRANKIEARHHLAKGNH